MGNTCTNLERYAEKACDFYKCVAHVKGLASNSTSPTDYWILSLKQGAAYNNTPISWAFIKIFLDTNNPYELALLYEIKIYRDIIRPLLDKNICPNFVRYLGSGTQCSFDQLYNFLTGGRTSLTDQEAQNNLLRNIKYMMNPKGDRKAVTDSGMLTRQSSSKKEKVKEKFNFLITHVVPPDSI